MTFFDLIERWCQPWIFCINVELFLTNLYFFKCSNIWILYCIVCRFHTNFGFLAFRHFTRQHSFLFVCSVFNPSVGSDILPPYVVCLQRITICLLILIYTTNPNDYCVYRRLCCFHFNRYIDLCSQPSISIWNVPKLLGNTLFLLHFSFIFIVTFICLG